MEFQFSFNSFLFISFLFLAFKLWKKSKSANKKSAGKLPPGPKKLPIIGNAHQLLNGGLPHQAISKLGKEYGPIMHLQLGEVPAVVVSCRDIAKDMLKTHDPAFAGRPERMAGKIIWYDNTDIAFCPYNEYWKQMRKICMMELLSPTNVRSFGYIRQDEVQQLTETIKNSAGVPINLAELIYSYTSSMTCRAAFGKVCRDKFTLIKHLKKAVGLAGGFELVDVFPSIKLLEYISSTKRELVKAHHTVDVILDNIISEHKQNLAATKKGNGESGDEDLIDVLVRLMESGSLQNPITNDNIKAVIFDMFSAGTETTSSTIEWAMSELMRNPDVMAKAQAEVRESFKGKKIIQEADVQKLKYLKLVVKETLRLHPPVPLLPRACREERVIEGYTITEKTQTMVNVWAMGRDPKYWNDPLEFQPQRFDENNMDFLGQNYEYLPFGSGRRVCPGVSFGIANVELPLAHFLYYFDWQIPGGVRP
uniref:Cytochrome p450 11294 n=1 Tax=Calotropis gigantea TaxID=4066 RepID=A0A977JB32_CALGI|nr:cytochrome p450 11294 [Calotropis gigantea]